MKIILRFAALSLAIAAAALAQGPFGPRGAGGPPDPATRVQNQVARLTTLLSLTSTQASQATTIFTNAQTSVSPLETTLRTNHDSLSAAVKSNAVSTIDQLASMIGSLTGQIAAIQSKADAAFYAILTTEQRTKFDQLGGGPGGFGRGPGGPPPGRR